MKSHEQLLHWVEDQLRTGALITGARLPSERDLAEQLGISRASVREGVRILEAMGMVRAATGSGVNSGTTITAEPHVPLASALRLHLASSTLPFKDIVQTRVLLETWSALHAEAGHDALERAGAILDVMDASAMSAEEFLTLDTEFHVTLSAAASNAVVHAMMSGLRESARNYALESIQEIDDWPALSERLRGEHRAVLAALRAGDVAAGARALQEHIEGFYRATHASAVEDGESQH